MLRATSNSGGVRRRACAFGLAGLLGVVLSARSLQAAETNPPAPAAPTGIPSPGERADKKLQTARAQFVLKPANATNAWQLGQACFEWSELLKDPNQQEKFAREGIAACRQALTLDPKSAPAHYYLAMTLGQFADTKRNLAALKMVKEMEHEFLAARELDEQYDFAGADRNLGLLYFESPTIISIGSRAKARQHLLRAVELSPDFPENRLNLIETLLKWGDTDDARRELKALEKSLPALKDKFPVESWTKPPADWQRRLASLQKKITPTK